MPACRKWHFQASWFQNFPGEHAPRPPKGRRLKAPKVFTAANFNRLCRLPHNLLKPLHQPCKGSVKMTLFWTISSFIESKIKHLLVLLHSNFSVLANTWKLEKNRKLQMKNKMPQTSWRWEMHACYHGFVMRCSKVRRKVFIFNFKQPFLAGDLVCIN